MTRYHQPAPPSVHVVWVDTGGRQHLFAGQREGVISMCGGARHPKAPTPNSSTNNFCFACVRNYRAVKSGGRWL